jgi:hypothetical protein
VFIDAVELVVGVVEVVLVVLVVVAVVVVAVVFDVAGYFCCGKDFGFSSYMPL